MAPFSTAAGQGAIPPIILLRDLCGTLLDRGRAGSHTTNHIAARLVWHPSRPRSGREPYHHLFPYAACTPTPCALCGLKWHADVRHATSLINDLLVETFMPPSSQSFCASHGSIGAFMSCAVASVWPLLCTGIRRVSPDSHQPQSDRALAQN